MTDESGTLARAYASVRREAEIMAGKKGDLRRRAMVYHRLFRHSGGNHVFPILAAHGALWGKGYFAVGTPIARGLSLLDLHRPALRRERLASLTAFADAIRDIHRRVCIEVYATYHFSAVNGLSPGADRHVDPALLDALNRCHHARRFGRSLPRAERAGLFEAFFRWEQRAIVGPSVDAAVAAFDWDRVRVLALRPTIRFSYMPRRSALRFANFASMEERIEKGLRAYELAEEIGWERVEAALTEYGDLPVPLLKAADAVLAATRAPLADWMLLPPEERAARAPASGRERNAT